MKKRLEELLEYALWKGTFADFAFAMFLLSMAVLGFVFSVLLIVGIIRWMI